MFSRPTLVSLGIWLVPACTAIFLWKTRLARSVTVSLALSWVQALGEKGNCNLCDLLLHVPVGLGSLI